MTKEEIAKQYYSEGCNCCQAVVRAFSDEAGIDEKFLLRLASSFGGGMGRLGEVCGAVSGMFMILGLMRGYDADVSGSEKNAHYDLIYEAGVAFRKKYGSLLCRDLKSDTGRQISCGELVACAAAMTKTYLKK